MNETDAAEAFADDTPLVELFGDGPRPRLLSVLVDERGGAGPGEGAGLTAGELARQAGVARPVVADHIDALAAAGAVEVARGADGDEQYALAAGGVGETLYELDGRVLRSLVD